MKSYLDCYLLSKLLLRAKFKKEKNEEKAKGGRAAYHNATAVKYLFLLLILFWWQIVGFFYTVSAQTIKLECWKFKEELKVFVKPELVLCNRYSWTSWLVYSSYFSVIPLVFSLCCFLLA